MLRKFGHVLVVLGVFLALLGILARFYAYPKLAVAPLETNASTAPGADEKPSVAVGQNVRIFSIAQGKQITTTITNTRNTVAQVADSEKLSDLTGRDLAIYETFAANQSAGGNVESAGYDRVAFDRKTGLAFDCASQSQQIQRVCDEKTGTTVRSGEIKDFVQQWKQQRSGMPNLAQLQGAEGQIQMLQAGDPGFRQGFEGLYFKLPFNVQKKTYPFWDGDLGRSAPLDYVGTESVQGLTTYKFEQNIAPTKVGTRSVPKVYTMLSKAQTKNLPNNLTLDEYYGNTRTLWVEPETGAIVKGQEQLDTTYRCPDSYGTCAGEVAVIATRGTVTYDDATVTANADMYKPLSMQLTVIRVYLPWGGVIVGVLLALLGVVMIVRGRKSRSSKSGDHVASDDSSPMFASA